MSDDVVRNQDENLRIAYAQVCSGYQAVDDFRAKLLGLLPLASGTGIFLLLDDALGQSGPQALPTRFLLPTGLFGFAVTLGLYFYELRGIQYCTHLISAGKALERKLKIRGRFTTRPKTHVAGSISELSAAHLIYAAVLAAWAFVAALFAPSPDAAAAAPNFVRASSVALAVFVVVFAFAFRVNLRPPKKRDKTAAGDNRVQA